MGLKDLTLQNFRNHHKANFLFSPHLTLVVGPNTSGKTNILEAIGILSEGKGFKSQKDAEVISFEQEITRISGTTEEQSLEVIFSTGMVQGIPTPSRKFLVNGVSKRKIDFIGHVITVLFTPSDLDIISDSPSIRRGFLDTVILSIDRDYRYALSQYEKAIRQRNALLHILAKGGRVSEVTLDYFSELVIRFGNVITEKRAAFIAFVNAEKKDICDFFVTYDKSVISEERLMQYKDAERASGVTLVGPHRDDFFVELEVPFTKKKMNVKYFGSRGQQRLAVLQLKVCELLYKEKAINTKPMLLLDDIFSELDMQHSELIASLVGRQQTIITSAHKEVIPEELIQKGYMIKLGR